MMVAEVTSKLSYAERAKVGCIIVRDGNIISFSYNGTIKGFSNVCELADGTTDEVHVLHSESNALTKALKAGISVNQAELYVTLSPCLNCAKLIIQSGIKKVYYAKQYRLTEGLTLLGEAGVQVEHFPL